MRLYSKTKAIASHTVWTEQEVLPVPFYFAGPLALGARLGLFKVGGRDMWLTSMSVALAQPAVDRTASFQLNFATAGGTATGAYLIVPGIATHAETTLISPLALPSGSYWQTQVSGVTRNSSGVPTTGLGLTLTYSLTFANGPAINLGAVYSVTDAGIGFWEIKKDFVVQ